MKKIIVITFLSLGLFFLANSQQTIQFTFVKSTILQLEKQAKYNDDGMDGKLFSNKISKKRMLGMYLVDDTTSSPDYNSEKYIKFSSIPITEKFEMITDAEFGSRNWEGNLFLQNVRTKQKYV